MDALKNVLVTGSNGFVAHFLIEEILKSTQNIAVYGCSNHKQPSGQHGIEYYECDIADIRSVKRVIADIQPDQVFHLAAISNPREAEQYPHSAYNVNFMGTVNLLESLKSLGKNVKILVVGSSECYGASLTQISPPNKIKEEHSCEPLNHYGMSKFFAEKVASKYCNFKNLDIFCTRSFNHSGPGQVEGFVIPDFCKQLARIAVGAQTPTVTVGNLNVIRDFLDVRDVVQAYMVIISSGKKGAVYNVCSGEGVTLSRVLDELIRMSGLKNIIIKTDKTIYRKNDVRYIVGDNSKLKKLGWDRNHSLHDMLQWSYSYWTGKMQE